MTPSKMAWLFLALAAVMVGFAEGGPRAAGVVEAVGADPVQEDCNGNALESPTCPAKVDSMVCGPGTFNVVRTEQPGTNWGGRYNNDQPVCNRGYDGPCKKYTMKKVDPKTCKDKLSPAATTAE